MAHEGMASDQGLHAVAITDNVESRSRHLARIWSAIAVLGFVGLAATIGVPRGPDLETWERSAQLTTLGVLAVATLIAWKYEGVGGSIMLVGSVALGVLATLQNQPLIAFVPALVFLVPATAFLVAWHRTRSYAAVVALAIAIVTILVTGSLAAQAMYDHGYGAAHPQSSLADPPTSPVLWMWSGAVTDSSAVVVTRVDTTGEVSLTLTTANGEEHHLTAAATDGVWRFAATNLEPLTEYTYQFVVDGLLRSERTGRFRTFSANATSFRIAVGSCSRLGSNGLVYETILAMKPDLFLAPGDFYYADHVATSDQFSAAFDETLTRPAQGALYASVPIAYVWDDHDYGGNDGDGTAPTRDLARAAYSTYVPHYPLTASRTINQAFTIGRVRIVMLDNRSARDPKAKQDGPDKTMLGADQLGWLKDELLMSNDAYPVIIVVNSVPWVADTEEGADHWGGYSTERQHIADFISSNNIDGLLMVAGDAHMVAIDDGSNTDYSALGNAGFPLLHAAALDRPGSTKGGPYSEGAFPGGGQFGLIDVTDDGSGKIDITLTGFDWTGSVKVEYAFTIEGAGVAR